MSCRISLVRPTHRLIVGLVLSSALWTATACSGPRPIDDPGIDRGPDAPPPVSQAPPREASPWLAEDVRSATSRGGSYLVRWRPKGGDVPKNEHFALEAWVFDQRGSEDRAEAPRPLPGAIVIVSGWMPDHKHGMIRKPGATDHGDGSYTVEGMLFHMGGHWELFFDLIVDGLSERTTFEVDL